MSLAQRGLVPQQYPVPRLTGDWPRHGLERKPQLLENQAQTTGSSLELELRSKGEVGVIVWRGGGEGSAELS